ncbi:MAG: RNA-guided endonuclease TnpB family protein [Cyanobacteria bacterium P01_A01_bin.83]
MKDCEEIPIPKKDGTKRILKVPTIADRAWQCLVKYALEPAHEATFHERSYGFRPGRSTHDAQKVLFNNLRSSCNGKDKRVLEIDIEKCFDRISHKAILNRVIAPNYIKEGLNKCLKSGVNPKFPEQGTPQGGVISPLLANISLNGIEKIGESKRRPFEKPKSKGIRYADDMVFILKPKDDAEQLLAKIEEFLVARGMNVSQRKTKVTASTDTDGFDFLGWHFYVQRDNGKFRSTPSRDNFKAFRSKVKHIAYKLFFKQHKKGTRPPSFKKTRKYKSFTLKQAGYKFLSGNKIRIGNRVYKFSKSREIQGKVKTLTIKRNNLGELFILVVSDYVDKRSSQAACVLALCEETSKDATSSFGVVTGKIAAFDAGCEAAKSRLATLCAYALRLKTFLTVSDGTSIESPLFFKQSRNKLKAASRNLSSKKKGSNNWYKAKDHLNRVHEDISNKRRDWFWKLAHDLTNKYDVLIFEDLNLDSMKRLWGRKVSDLSFATFLEILQTVAAIKGKVVHFVDRYYPSSKTCSHCGYIHKELSLSDRFWDCPSCQTKNIPRDWNASVNLLRVGASTLGLGDVREVQLPVAV